MCGCPIEDNSLLDTLSLILTLLDKMGEVLPISHFLCSYGTHSGIQLSPFAGGRGNKDIALFR